MSADLVALTELSADILLDALAATSAGACCLKTGNLVSAPG